MSTAITKPSLSLELSPKFKNILFTTDLSPSSELALPYARAIAQRYGATVHILHVVTPVPIIGPEGESYPQVDKESALAQQAIDRLIQSGALKNVLYTTTVDIGLLWDAVAKAIAELKVDLIVLGTHGRGVLKHLLLGSIAEQIFRRADCPVLTVGPKTRDRAPEAKLDTILYATDFSPASRAALPFALSLARANGSKLVLVHAVHTVASGEGVIMFPAEELAENARVELANFVPEEAGIDREIITRYGYAADVILKVAEETDAALIVMGAHRGTSSHTPWAVAHQVVCHATAPVLTVRG
jgi:nucleotide-binding universal stress UspA family protein